MFKGTNEADKSDWGWFRGTMKIWITKTHTQIHHNKKLADRDLAII